MCACVYYYEYSRVFLKEKNSTDYNVGMGKTNKRRPIPVLMGWPWMKVNNLT